MFPTCGMKLSYPGDVLPSQLQREAQKLLLKIGNLPESTEFSSVADFIIPSPEFLLGETVDKMIIRVIHVFGVERLCVALFRKSYIKVHGSNRTELFPMHIVSFAAALVSASYCIGCLFIF